MGGSREVASTPTATRITFSAAGEIPASIRVKAKKATVIEIKKFLCLLNMFSSLSGPAGSQVGSITIANAIYLFTIL
jgi:hypothetical protein